MKIYFVFTIFVVIISYFNCYDYLSELFPNNGARAFAVMRGGYGNKQIRGTIFFQQITPNGPVFIKVNLTGAPKGFRSKHGLHVHQNTITSTGDSTTEICDSSGPHFNPYNSTHGDISAYNRHAGDYGNVESDGYGNIVSNFTDHATKLYGINGIIGRTIVLHQLQDDLGFKNDIGSKTTGNSGARIACGIVGIIE